MLHKAQIGILSCMWKRHEVFKIFASGLRRLMKEFNITVVIVGSEGEKSRDLCNDFIYVEHKNSPLGAKNNYGMMQMKKLNPDYVMYLGSDDIVNNKFFEMVVSGAIGYDMYGVLDCYIYEVKSKTLAYWPGYNNQRRGETLGMGRILSRNLLEKLKWQPWISQLDKGMDWSMMQRVKKFKIKSGGMFMRNGMFAVDIKTPVNICSLGNYKNIKRVNVSLLKKLPEYERITRL